MKPRLLIYLTCGLVVCGGHLATAETVWESSNDDTSFPYHQRIGVAYRMNFNIDAKFNNLGGFAPMSNPGPATGANVDRTYDDGFNKVDVSGNANGRTWFWGYNNSSQIVGDTVVMSSRSSGAIGSTEASDDPQHGMEVTYNLELGGSHSWRWGLEAAGNYTAVGISDNHSLSGNVRTISDAFALNGVTPPLAPYSGTFLGPGVIIDSTPLRTITTSAGATITGQRSLDADLFGMRLGPYIEFPIWDRFSVSLGGGLALVHASSDFKFNERVTIAGLGSRNRSGSNSDDSLLAGGYVSGNLLYNLTHEFSLFTGVQFYSVGSQTVDANGKSAELDLSESLGVVFGGNYSF